jgi:hypothetical protein
VAGGATRLPDDALRETPFLRGLCTPSLSIVGEWRGHKLESLTLISLCRSEYADVMGVSYPCEQFVASAMTEEVRSPIESWQPCQVRGAIYPHTTSVRNICAGRLLAEPQIAVLVEAQRAGVPGLDDQP